MRSSRRSRRKVEKMNRFMTISVVLLILLGMSVYGTKTRKDDLPNFSKVNENLYRGGQPSSEGIKQLAGMGIKTVINFRDSDDKMRREKQLVEENGMKFFNPHLSNWFKPKDKDIDAIMEMIRDPENQPVFVHCKRGADRTGTVVAVYRMKYDGWDDKQANLEAKKFGIGWWQFWMKDYIHDFYKKMKEDQVDR